MFIVAESTKSNGISGEITREMNQLVPVYAIPGSLIRTNLLKWNLRLIWFSSWKKKQRRKTKSGGRVWCPRSNASHRWMRMLAGRISTAAGVTPVVVDARACRLDMDIHRCQILRTWEKSTTVVGRLLCPWRWR